MDKKNKWVSLWVQIYLILVVIAISIFATLIFILFASHLYIEEEPITNSLCERYANLSEVSMSHKGNIVYYSIDNIQYTQEELKRSCLAK